MLYEEAYKLLREHNCTFHTLKIWNRGELIKKTQTINGWKSEFTINPQLRLCVEIMNNNGWRFL